MSGAVAYRVRSQLRTGWLAMVALVLLVGRAGGAVPTVPALVIAGIGVAVLVLAVLAGLVPGWRSSRRLPAIALRAE
jgi:hypothetical protein